MERRRITEGRIVLSVEKGEKEVLGGFRAYNESGSVTLEGGALVVRREVVFYDNGEGIMNARPTFRRRGEKSGITNPEDLYVGVKEISEYFRRNGREIHVDFVKSAVEGEEEIYSRPDLANVWIAKN